MRIKNYLGRNFRKSRIPDRISKSKRSALMSKIRSKDTNFEREFTSSLRKITRDKFKTCVTLIRGKPDVVFSKKKICVFLDSDFWHGWEYPRWAHLLKNDFWRTKIINNRKRDKKIAVYLKYHGWSVLRIWEHDIKKNKVKCLEKVTKVLKQKAI